MRLEGLHKAIEDQDYNENEAQAQSLASIILLCEYGPAISIGHCRTGFEAWKVLKDLYTPEYCTSTYLLLQRFFGATQSDYESAQDYITEMRSSLDDLAVQGLEMPELASMMWLLRNLDGEYCDFAQAVSQILRVNPTAYDWTSLASEILIESQRLTLSQKRRRILPRGSGRLA